MVTSSVRLSVGLRWETLSLLAQKLFVKQQRRSSKSSIVYKLYVIDKRRSYVNNEAYAIEFQVGVKVMLNSIALKGVVKFRQTGKVKPSSIGIQEEVPEYTWSCERGPNAEEKIPSLFANPESASQATS
ncbi:hypothetical protein Tco_0002164 [Tanacetum coccineum]